MGWLGDAYHPFTRDAQDTIVGTPQEGAAT
jgi:hypothetical protein